MEGRQNILRTMKICRFCLSEDEPLTNIYKRNVNEIKRTPLPLQLMACVAIEVFENDGMPQLICNSCRSQTLQSYIFKTNCKKADDALKFFLATGQLIKPEHQDENEPVKIDTPKRPLERKVEPKLKRSKTQNAEILTLNFAADLNQDNHHLTENVEEEEEEDGSVSQVEQFDQDEDIRESKERITFVNMDEGQDVQEEEEEDQPEIVNRSLKVNQVQTDCYPCPHCERSFPLKQLLDLHVKNHNRERNYSCEECDKSFFTKYDLNKHLLTHTGMKPFTCVVCQKTFSRESLLHRHEKIHIDVPKYLCPQCDRTFLTGEDLDAHTAKHKKKRPFVCKLCHKSFVFKQGLERHEMTSHNNVKPHKCNYCEASFTSAIKLTRHVTSHAGLRPYPCKICGRTFLLSHHLTRHMRSHYAAQQSTDSIGQHKCDICSMAFTRKDFLINHSAIHSMVNLKCVICNTEFDNVDKVKEHITTHLSDLPFPCEKCDYSFETQEQLEDHELKHAEMEYEDQIEQEVFAEARNAAEKDTEEEDDEEYEEDIAEFTITNDINNPEFVRRSKRTSKIKNYAEFLNDELGSDYENHTEEQEEKHMVEGDEEVEQDEKAAPEQYDEFKPIVRTEGTKVYTRKSAPPKVDPKPAMKPNSVVNPNISKTIELPPTPSIEQLQPTELIRMPEKEIFNMKVGDKTVTVQKLLLTKDQLRAMTKEGKIEKKGNTFILKKSAGQNFQTLNVGDLLTKSDAVLKTSLKKTYERKAGSSEDNNESFTDSTQINLENISAEESVSSM